MSKKVFDYCGMLKIGIQGPTNLLERIAENIEGEINSMESSDCNVSIFQSKKPERIMKDKRYDYLTIDEFGTKERPSIKYTRYNTHVRTIHQNSPNEYSVEANVELDESSGLICVRNYLSNHPRISSFPLLHASLVNIGGKGVLIASNSRQGKTTSTVYLLGDRGAVFVGDENIILDTEGDIPEGMYVPRTPRVRFSTIEQSGLSKIFDNVEIANATQYIDHDAIERIISSRNFYVDAGMTFSRKAFCDLLQTSSRETSNVDVVMFPKYLEGDTYSVRNVKLEEGVERLSNTGLMRKSAISPRELTGTQVDLQLDDFKDVDFIEVSFSDINSLRKGGFRI